MSNLRQTPTAPTTRVQSKDVPCVISLFSGAGGLDWGFEAEGFNVSLAIDISPAAIRTHKRNFPNSAAYSADLIELGPEGVLKLVLAAVKPGTRIGVIGGPPCQGFSRANTTSKADDPRNQLPSLYIKIVRELQAHYFVDFIVLENVPGIRDKKHADTFAALRKDIETSNFELNEMELFAPDFGVPQIRRRVFLIAMKKGQNYGPIEPQSRKGKTTVADAIKGLEEPAFFNRSLTIDQIPLHPNHWTMLPKSLRFLNPNLLDVKSEKRSFKRLRWNLPSLTVAYGHREIHIHPDGHRRLSIYEALLLQGFPETFVLEGNLSEQVNQVSNAVPPPIAQGIALALKIAIKQASTKLPPTLKENTDALVNISQTKRVSITEAA